MDLVHLPVLSHNGTRLMVAALLSALALNMGVAAVAMLWPHEKRAFRHIKALHWICALYLTNDRRQRAFILQHLVGVSNCLLGLAALNYGVLRGVVDPIGCAWLTFAAIAVISCITFIVRSGMNNRFSDPSLLTAHIYSAEFFLAWGYYLGGPCRPVGLVLLFVVLMTNFSTNTTKVVRKTSIAALLMFGAAMVRIAWEERSLHNGPQIQLVYFGVLLMVLLSLYLLVNNLHRIRAVSTQRKKELVEAMATIQELATRDELTRLFNRRHMLSLLNAEKVRCDRVGHPFSIALLDVDHFKRVNDAHGHGAGDEVLREVAAHLTASMRDMDIVARWGGEEFLVLFPETDGDQADLVLRRVLKALASKEVLRTRPDMRISFSGGLAQFEPGESLDGAIDRADSALYQAKSNGRNRIERANSAVCAGQHAAH